MTDTEYHAPDVQEQTKPHSAEADASQLAAEMLVSNVTQQAMLGNQTAFSCAVEADTG